MTRSCAQRTKHKERTKNPSTKNEELTNPLRRQDRNPSTATGAPRGRGRLTSRPIIGLGALAGAIVVGALAWRILPSLAPGLWPLTPGPIVLISIDTLRADRLPIYGYDKVRTPAIDALAADSVVFDRAYAHSPQTFPSHTSIFTGRLPFEHGVRDNLGFTVKADEPLLAERLRGLGYATAGFVSSYVLREQVGIGRGFDLYDSQMPTASPEMSVGQVQRDGIDTMTLAARWVAAQATSRFFLFLHLYEPHKPYAPPDRFRQYDPYDGEVAYADEIVGRFLQRLRDRDLYDEATIVLLSDHGEGLRDHGEEEHGVFLYDEAIRVPLVIKLPGGGGAGRRAAQPAEHVDLVPTILELVGAPVPDGLAGRSVRPALLDPEASFPERGAYAEALYPRYHFGWSELYALTDARYRYIKAPHEELYDLQNDPDERRNIAADRPQVRAAMRTALDRLLAGRPIDQPSRVSDEDRERLQALGYVGMQADLSSKPDGEALPDPKDKVKVLEQYREAVNVAGERRFPEAIALFEKILTENPSMVDVWQQLGNLQVRAGRYDDAVRSYKRLVELRPTDPTALISVAAAQLRLRRLDEAQAHAELAVKVAPKAETRSIAGAHEMLAKIALARKDREGARRHAELARQADPTLPLPTYVQGLMLHTEARYAEALPLFEETLRQLQSRTMTMNEVHFYTGDTLARLGRNAEAAAQFKEEIRLFPHNARAWASLAMLYRSIGRDADAERAVDSLLHAVPTPDGYGLAVRLWTIFGEPERARAVRQQGLQRFGTIPTVDLARSPQS